MTKGAISFSLVGPGRVGSSVALALSRSGWTCRSIITNHLGRQETALLTQTFPSSAIGRSFSGLSDDFKLLLVAVKDDQIKATALRLASLDRIDWTKKVVLHFSGVVEPDALSALKGLGAEAGALHPIAPFARRFSPDSGRGIYYDFLGTKGALRYARRIVSNLDSNFVLLHSNRERTLLHAASVIASSSLVIAVKSAEGLISNFIERESAKSILGKLLLSTAENVSSITGISALTGPLVRGDFSVIKSHVEVLESDKLLLDFYKSYSLLGIDELMKEKPSGALKKNLNRIKKFLEEK